MSQLLSRLDREYLCVVNLDSKLRPINYNIVAVGDVNSCHVRIANIFKSAILSNAASIMLMHNHPSGDVAPSKADFDITRKVYEASQLLDVSLIEHIIIGGGSGDSYSMYDSGDLDQICNNTTYTQRMGRI